MRQIGDMVWVARNRYQEFTQVCPDCLGTCAAEITLANGDKHSIACGMCDPGGYIGSTGYIKRTQTKIEARQMEISAIEATREKTTYRFYDWSCDEVFDTEAEALVVAEKVRLEKEDYDHKHMIWDKEHRDRTWTFECSYYRRQISDAKQTIAYAEARLNIAKAKAKEPADRPDREEGR